jgi:hypothetical protein
LRINSAYPNPDYGTCNAYSICLWKVVLLSFTFFFRKLHKLATKPGGRHWTWFSPEAIWETKLICCLAHMEWDQPELEVNSPQLSHGCGRGRTRRMDPPSVQRIQGQGRKHLLTWS